MSPGLEETGLFHGLEKMAAFYAERARGGVGLIVTGGISPNDAGRGYPFAAKLSTPSEARHHEVVTKAVHAEGGKMLMQILHTGRYAYTPFAVAPSPIKAPIGWVTPSALSAAQVDRTIGDYVRSAELAKSAGYDGVEVMGSEGYLINQFIVAHTNKRTDEWGGSYENRIRFPVEIVKRMRLAVGPDFIIMFRLSMLDLIPGGSSWDEVLLLARAIEDAGATLINTGIGWHEARVPTIATKVPRGAFTWVTRKLKLSQAVKLPLVTTNRINMPQVRRAALRAGPSPRARLRWMKSAVLRRHCALLWRRLAAGGSPLSTTEGHLARCPAAPHSRPQAPARTAPLRANALAQVAEDILARGDADLVSMARPFLADPDLLRKAAEGKEGLINTCIGCNQACLDHTFQAKQARAALGSHCASSCAVPSRAMRRTALDATGAAACCRLLQAFRPFPAILRSPRPLPARVSSL